MVIGALFLALGASCGAIGAHSLKAVLTPERLDSWATASWYLLAMGGGLLGASNLTHKQASRMALYAVIAGTILFSGSIMALVLMATFEVGESIRAFIGPLTPLGGLMMIGGWLVWAWQKKGG